MVLATPSPAFLLDLWDRQYTPLLYGGQRILSCRNRSAPHAFKCAMRWLDNEDLAARRALAKNELTEPGWAPRPLPALETITMVPPTILEWYEGESIYAR